MNIRPIGGIFWRLDASGNLTAYDTAGNVLAKFVGTAFSGFLNKATPTNGAALTTTTSATYVTTGINMQFTPKLSGRILVVVNLVNLNNSVAGDGIRLGIFQSAGSFSPSGNVVPDGTLVFETLFTSTSASARGSGSFAVLITGLTAGTTYTFELAFKVDQGGTATYGFVVTGGGNPLDQQMTGFEV